MEFAKEERPRILLEHGHLSTTEVGKELGKRWKDLKDEDREIYLERSRYNQEQYKIRKEEYDKNAAEVTLSSSTGVISHPGPGNNPPLEVPQPNHSLLPTEFDPLPSSSNDPSSSLQAPSKSIIKLDHLGFAKQDGFEWHPALKTGDMARGTRVKVTLFGTGELATVNKSRWLLYSDHSEARIKSTKLSKSKTFLSALEQLKSLRKKVLDGSQVTTSGIGFDPQIGGRRFKNLNKDHLQIEEEENAKKMEKKMFQKEGSLLWTCKDCAWQGKFRHKAKAHARDCGQRKRMNQKKSKEKKYECSNADCDESFALRSQLSNHYR